MPSALDRGEGRGVVTLGWGGGGRVWTVEAEQDGLNRARASSLCNTAAVSAARCGIGAQEATRQMFSKRREEDARARSPSLVKREARGYATRVVKENRGGRACDVADGHQRRLPHAPVCVLQYIYTSIIYIYIYII
jgi:hypothetical protein